MEPAAKLDPMTETALRSLHDIAVPPPVSWMPQTWGWAVLAAIACVLALAWVILAALRYHRNAYRREAMRQLDQIESSTAKTKPVLALREIAELVKRTALAAWPRKQVAAIDGADWVQFLSTSGGTGKALNGVLDDLEYRPDAALSALAPGTVEDAALGARRWIEKHHVSA